MSNDFVPKPYWHIHHDELLEWTTEPIENRIEFIQHCKPLRERALRLRLLQPVRGALPVAVVEARRAYYEALADHADEIAALHAQECPDCPWDGRTIFPEDRR